MRRTKADVLHQAAAAESRRAVDRRRARSAAPGRHRAGRTSGSARLQAVRPGARADPANRIAAGNSRPSPAFAASSVKRRTAVRPAGAQRRVGMQEEQPRRAARRCACRELSAAPGRRRHDGGAGLAGDRERVVARAAVADRDGQSEAIVAAAEAGDGAGQARCCVQGRDDDVDVRRHWLQAAPPSTQNLAQCGWLRRTAPTLSASVSPSSNCGS